MGIRSHMTLDLFAATIRSTTFFYVKSSVCLLRNLILIIFVVVYCVIFWKLLSIMFKDTWRVMKKKLIEEGLKFVVVALMALVVTRDVILAAGGFYVRYISLTPRPVSNYVNLNFYHSSLQCLHSFVLSTVLSFANSGFSYINNLAFCVYLSVI